MSDVIDKKTLRSQYIQKRQTLDPKYAKDAAMKIAQHLQEFVPNHNYAIAGYSAARGEIDLFPALTRLHQRNNKICLPIVLAPNTPLVFRHWQPGESLEKGVYNIAVPSSAAPKVTPDIVIVPLVAFDKKGHRLGYGAGYYDRTIQELRDRKPIQVLGAAYAMQQLDKLPKEMHDEQLDGVVTEEGITSFA